MWAVLCLSAILAGPESAGQPARSTMKAAGHCFLITLDGQGQPQARIMDPFEPEPDMSVWLGTHRGTRKVQQIRNNPQATLAYFDPEGKSYVTLLGHARLVEDREERRRRWKEQWEAFYPGGAEGEHYLLIHFIPSRIEIMSLAHDLASDPLAWRPAILTRHGDGWKTASH